MKFREAAGAVAAAPRSARSASPLVKAAAKGDTYESPEKGVAMRHEVQRDEQELAKAISQGSSRRPEQAFGSYFVGRSASCALGAAYEGLYRLPEEAGQIHPKRLERLFDCLEGTIRACPEEGCRKRLMLAAIIVHLNDDHRWSRERIAAWVESGPTPVS